MKRIRDIFIGVLIGCMIFATPVLADSVLTKIDIVLNGINVQVEGVDVEVDSILYNGTTYLPMRKVAELVGKDIEWKQETRTANIVSFTNKNDAKDSDVMETTIDNKVVIFNIDDVFNCYAERNGKIYYHAFNVVGLMNEQGRNGDYGVDINNLHLGNVRYFDKDNNTVIENVEYEMFEDRVFISKDYYENTIFPLIK